MPRAFVIRPFGVKKDSSGQALDFDAVHRDLIEPALIALGFSGSTTIEIESAGNIRADMFALILEADVVVCDITVHNANVFYELGVRHALRKRGTIMLKGAALADLRYDALALAGLMLVAMVIAISRFRRTLD